MKDQIRLIVIAIISLVVLTTGVLFSVKAFMNNNIGGGVLGVIVALIIIMFAYFVYKRGNKDLKNGFPIHDGRSKRVLEKASSKAFYVSLYLLILVGFLSDEVINFRDISQATSISVGLMALLFGGFWLHYNKKEMWNENKN